MTTVIFLICLYFICSVLSTMYFYTQTHGVSKRQLLKINFIAELHAIKWLLLLLPIFVIWYFVSFYIFSVIYGGLDDLGVNLLVQDYPIQFLYITVSTLPILLVTFILLPILKGTTIYAQIEKAKLKFTTKKNKQYFQKKWASVNTIGIIIFSVLMYFDLVFPIHNLLYIPRHSLKAIPATDYNWAFVSGQNFLNAILRQGESFACDYYETPLITTKNQCNKCPNRKWTGQTCILTQCPQEAPILAIDPNFKHNRGAYCRTCEIKDNVAYFYTATADECFKCPNTRNWSFWDGAFNAYHCILN